MNFFRRISTRRTTASLDEQQQTSASKSQIMQSPSTESPPAYSAYPSQALTPAPAPASLPASQASTQADSPFAFLGQFDTVFVVDDSGSMAGRSWGETSDALSAISPIITEQDADGVDLYFLNHRNPSKGNPLGGYTNVRTTAGVQEIFRNVRPSGGTPTGTRLNAILKEYLADLAKSNGKRGPAVVVKPLNIIVITDGVATDDVESSIVSAAKKLDKMGAEPWQVGIQFFQVGQERAAAKDLQELDDALAEEHGVRDMVDTVPWNGTQGSCLNAEGIMKVTMGAINRRLDRKKNSDTGLRTR